MLFRFLLQLWNRSKTFLFPLNWVHTKQVSRSFCKSLTSARAALTWEAFPDSDPELYSSPCSSFTFATHPGERKQDIKYLCRDGGGSKGGEESSLCALSYHLLPLLICCAAAERLEEWRRKRRRKRGGLNVFLPDSATLSPGCWGRRRRREARQTEESAGDVKPDLLPYLLPPSIPPPPLPPCQRASETPGVIWSGRSRLETHSKRGRGGGGKKKEGKGGEQRRRREG